MGADFIVHRECEAKRQLGGGDTVQGTVRMLGMLKARDRADAIAAMMAREGQDPETATIRVVVQTPQGNQERDVTLAEMRAQAGPLEQLGGACAECDSCALAERFGCVGYLTYPLSEALERWILARAQPADTLGGALMRRAIRDFGYDGSAMGGWRSNPSLMERTSALTTGDGPEAISSDQILQAILMVGSELDPMHGAMLLLWLGALRVDGVIPGPGTAQAPSALAALSQASTPAQRQALAKVELGEPSEDRGVRGFQQLLFALYVAWVLDRPLLLDA